MPDTIAERLAVVETKVSTLEGLAPKIDEIYNYVVADKASRKTRNRYIAGIVALFPLADMVVRLWRK